MLDPDSPRDGQHQICLQIARKSTSTILFTSSSDLKAIYNPHFHLPYFSQSAGTCSGSGSEHRMSDSHTDYKLDGMDHAEVHYFNRCIYSHVLPVADYTLNTS